LTVVFLTFYCSALSHVGSSFVVCTHLVISDPNHAMVAVREVK